MTCEHCNGKGYNTQMYGTRYSADFVGDKTYYIPPKIHKKTCKTCSGTGIKPVSPTPDSIETNSTSSLHSEKDVNKLSDPTYSWEKEFDEKFPMLTEIKVKARYGDDIDKTRLMQAYFDSLENELKAFISEVRQKAYEDGKKDGLELAEQRLLNFEQDEITPS